MDGEPTGELLSDIELCIRNHAMLQMDYIDKKGQASSRKVAPTEIRDDQFYAHDIAKNSIRLFNLNGVGSFEVVDEYFTPTGYTY